MFQIVLMNPEIPQNTGSIARTCAALQAPLHIVGKMSFEINEKRVRRAGLDYWPYVSLTQHSCWEEYITSQKPNKIWLIETKGDKLYHQADFSKGDAIVFGRETTGLSDEFLAKFNRDQILKIPIFCSGVRSLNLSNAVSIVAYEALRQITTSRSPS
ncbi:MAG TPA: tRNA (cytidine(34)-2'-O)-methyltransferase [Oligoflexia bacterium]|nr:tRNA (cytidine(34)-2'-O)-methyltransferase [Oligoflexia bacterium]HMP27274.1 tRNA (cytidine(34)-2'-O)-methyltransferase [Oligoflexia bacterium]